MQKYIDLFEERAGILEFDGKIIREKAESLAKAEVFELYKKEGGFLNKVDFEGEFQRFSEIDNNNFQ